MKRILTLLLMFMAPAFLYSAPAQVRFVADVTGVEELGDEVILLNLSLTSEFDITVRVTGETQIEDNSGDPLSMFDLAVGMTLKVEGVFTSAGIFAEEIEVAEGRNEFGLRGVIEAINDDLRQITVLGFTVQVPEETDIKDSTGNPLLFSELEVGQTVQVKGDVVEEMLVASEVKVKVRDKAFARVTFEGVVTSLSDTEMNVLIEGASPVVVALTSETDIKGDLALGVLVRVIGTIQPDLSVEARKVLVKELLKLAPKKLKMRLNHTRRVEVILRGIQDVDVELSIFSRDPAVAEPSASGLVIPAGKVTGFFEVSSGAVPGETVIEVSTPESLGALTSELEVEVRDRNADDDEGEGDQDERELEVRWSPQRINIPVNKTRTVRLRLNQPAPEELVVEIFVKKGSPELIEFPSAVVFEPGSKVAVLEIHTGSESGELELRATLPESVGGDTDDVEVVVQDRGKGKDQNGEDEDDGDGDEDDGEDEVVDGEGGV